MFSKRYLARIIYLACFAVLMAALAPGVSQILAAQQASHEAMADCHTRAAHPLSNHCGYCVMQADLPYLPTLATAPLPAQRPASLAPPAFRPVPSPFLTWLAAQPRAPPFA